MLPSAKEGKLAARGQFGGGSPGPCGELRLRGGGPELERGLSRRKRSGRARAAGHLRSPRCSRGGEAGHNPEAHLSLRPGRSCRSSRVRPGRGEGRARSSQKPREEEASRRKRRPSPDGPVNRRRTRAGAGFSPRASHPQGHLVMSGDIVGWSRLRKWPWHWVGRGRDCCATSYSVQDGPPKNYQPQM